MIEGRVHASLDAVMTLVGMAMLHGHSLHIDVWEGGRVVICVAPQ